LTVEAQIGGKLAQLGQRLINSAAKKTADDFFCEFRSGGYTEDGGVEFGGLFRSMPDSQRLTIAIKSTSRSQLPPVHAIRTDGAATLDAIRRALNEKGIRTARGARWHVSTVSNFLARAQKLDKPDNKPIKPL
jgi:hypothetical protein